MERRSSQPPYALRVDWLPPSALALPGRLGLTRAPGRWSLGRTVDSDARLREDVEAIAGVHRARLLVTLLERAELAELGDLRHEARRARVEWIHFPIPDVWVPSDVPATRRLVRRMLRTVERGDGVVVHCWGGLGRAGTIAASCLVARGTAPGAAIAAVRAARPGAVQTPAQEQFVAVVRLVQLIRRGSPPFAPDSAASPDHGTARAGTARRSRTIRSWRRARRSVSCAAQYTAGALSRPV